MLKTFTLTAIAVMIAAYASANDLKDLFKGQGEFSADLLISLNQKYPTGNMIFSPHSIYRCLLLAYLGAEGETERSLKEGLYLNWAPNKEAVARAFKAELVAHAGRKLKDTIELDTVDKIYITEEANLKSNLTDIIGNDLIEKVDFSDPENVRTRVNSFVEEVTKSHIQELLPPGSVGSNIVLVNAAFFKGQWANPFDPANTKIEAFNGPDQKSVKMMTITDQFYHGVNKEFNLSYLYCPYAGREHLMVFYLPDDNSPTAVDDLLGKLTVQTLESIDAATLKRVELKVPQMSLKANFLLEDVLEKMNITHLFSGSDLSGFADNVHMQFDDIIHKAVIDVDEYGTVAAAASASYGRGVYFDEPERFHLNRPFIFVLYDLKSDENLFTGVYRGPSEDQPSVSTPRIAA